MGNDDTTRDRALRSARWFRELDVPARRLDLCVERQELERRRLQWQAPRVHVRGYRKLYDEHIEQAHVGCDLDFLRGADRETLPEGLFHGWVGGW